MFQLYDKQFPDYKMTMFPTKQFLNNFFFNILAPQVNGTGIIVPKLPYF